MEYFRAGNIADLGTLDEVTYISAFGQILSGVEHLHSKGIAHRDLKPENFLVERLPFFRVAISDFGLAKTVPKSALLSTFCGSLTAEAATRSPFEPHTTKLLALMGGYLVSSPSEDVVLSEMLQVDKEKRWEAEQLLQYGLDGKLFRRRRVDDLVVCADDRSDTEEDPERSPSGATPRASSPEQNEEDVDATVIVDCLWTA
ncbi:hypothetical protein LTR54_018166 [Friedmanniomyces endolithicus]|nr:hypothetical protein LTR54_018166 [Friedmanniomyces endolithicus]